MSEMLKQMNEWREKLRDNQAEVREAIVVPEYDPKRFDCTREEYITKAQEIAAEFGYPAVKFFPTPPPKIDYIGSFKNQFMKGKKA